MPTKVQPAGEIQEDKNPFEEWAQMTGWHGVLDFFYAKTLVLKAVWGLVLAMGTFLAINQSYALLTDYLVEDKWITTITYEVPQEGYLPWPNFTLCNLNWLSKSKLLQQNVAHQPYIVQYLAHQKKGVEFYKEMLADGNETDNDNYIQYIDNQSDSTLKDIMAKFAMTCNDTMITCGLSQDFNLSNDSVRDCCMNSTASHEMSCFKINPSIIFKNERTKFAGAGYKTAIYFMLNNAPNDDYENVLYLEKPSAGFRITFYFGEDDTDPLNPSILSGPGRHSVVSISMQKTRTISRRRNQTGVQLTNADLPCREPNQPNYTYLMSSKNICSSYSSCPADRHRVIFSGLYTKAKCHTDCETRYQLDTCNCSDQYHLTLKNAPFCTGNSFECISDFSQLNNSSASIKSTKSGFNVTECRAKCLDSCDYDTVIARVTSTQFPAPLKLNSLVSYINLALNQTYDADTVSNFTLLEIFYENNQYKVVEKTERVPIDELIASIGGTLGVWTGISIISIFQALMYTFMGVRMVLQKLMMMCKKDQVQMISVK